ncbi:AAA family ATPase [Oerskovia sp. USHLN155]|uniref:AAA family ATPase n=1 Tax=Oerskovia sp. USHLN155 TaxID=3081288 RepID=UPI00301A86E1
MEISAPGFNPIDLGGVKIMKLGQESGRTELPLAPLKRLSGEYASLGQDIEYYEKLGTLPKAMRDAYLESMNDVIANSEVRERAEQYPAWELSLLRFGEAQHVLETAVEFIGGGSTRARQRASFSYVDPSSGSEVQFNFDDTGPVPGRCNALIGYNGAGKTRLLAEIARLVSKVGANSPLTKESPHLTGEDRTFAAVVAVSYSAFDTFKLPEIDSLQGSTNDKRGKTEFFGYTYCGLRRVVGADSSEVELKSISEIDREFMRALKSAQSSKGADAVRRALQIIGAEPSFGRIGIRPDEWVDDSFEAETSLGRLSTGHKIVLNIVVQLAAHLRKRSLVLLDEPESHLHPPLLAALLKATQYLLKEFDSFGLIATHSPVVLQEVPASSVRVLNRIGSKTTVQTPTIETFGSNIGEITRHVFSLDSSSTDYQGVLRELAQSRSEGDLEQLFPMGLSAQAHALFLRFSNRGG